MNVRDLIPWGRGNSQAPTIYREENGNPFLSLHREINRVFDDMFRDFDGRFPTAGSLSSFNVGWPSLEISETDKELKVSAEMPGLEEKDVEVLLEALREEDLAAHPTVKPVQMVEDAILDCSKPNGVILDPFVGSDTTLHAAHRAGRRGYGMELDPAYVDCAVRRLQKALQVEARLEDGRTFAEVEQQRCSKQEAA